LKHFGFIVRRKTMSLLKCTIFTALLFLLFCTSELYALDSNEVGIEKQKTTFSLGGIGKSLTGTINGLGKSLNGTVNGIGKTLGGTVKGLGTSVNGTMDGIGEFIEENGETILVAGLVFVYIMAEGSYYDSECGYDYQHGYNHCYNR
jgi:hypothetical protein